MNNEKDTLIAALGRTETVKDCEKIYKALFDAKRKHGIARARAKNDDEHVRREVMLFLDDVAAITGLNPATSLLYWEIAALTLGKRLADVDKQRANRIERDGSESWPDDHERMGDW
jgi:hypothetical protein